MVKPHIVRKIAGLVEPALNAGMKVPDDLSNYDGQKFRHFALFSSLNLNYEMPKPGFEWHNALVIAKFTIQELEYISWEQLCQKGYIRGTYVG